MVVKMVCDKANLDWWPIKCGARLMDGLDHHTHPYIIESGILALVGVDHILLQRRNFKNPKYVLNQNIQN